MDNSQQYSNNNQQQLATGQQPALNITTAPTPTTVTPQLKPKSTLLKITEYVLFSLAILVLISVVFGFNTMGMIGVGVLFVYGLLMILIGVIKYIRSQYDKKNYIGMSISIIVGLVLLYVFGWIALIGYWIVTLMLGFWELNS